MEYCYNWCSNSNNSWFYTRLISPSGAIIGFLIATIYAVYMVSGDYVNGAIHGALVGIVAAIILLYTCFNRIWNNNRVN